MKKIDLHIHTIPTFSDSDFTFCLETFKRYVAETNLDAVAVTNHDIFETAQYELIRNSLGITVFPGIEINFEKGHILLISDGSDLKDFQAKSNLVSQNINKVGDYISTSQLKNFFGDLEEYLLIPHYHKKPSISPEVLTELSPHVFTGEVDSQKKFIRQIKSEDKVVPVLFSDMRIKAGLQKFPLRHTFVDCGELTLTSLKACLKDKSKVALSTVEVLLKSKIRAVRDIFLLNRIGNFWPLLIKTYKLDNSENKDQFTLIASLLEKYSFRIYAINQSRGNTGQSKLYKLAQDFDGNFDALSSELIALILEYSDDRSFRTNLARANIYDKVGRKDLGYFFWKYENYLRATFQPKAPPMSEDEISDDSFTFKMSIEHIASQNPKKPIVNDPMMLPVIDQDFEDEYLHNLGNLTIDPFSANASKGNKDFLDKNDGYFVKAPFKTQNELETFLDQNKWTSKSITNRKQKLIEFAAHEWSC